MSCTNEEIAEKRRLALERLRATKQSSAAATNPSSGTNGSAVAAPVQQDAQSKALLIAENKRIALERLKSKQQNLAAKPLQAMRSSNNSSSPQGSSASSPVYNSASKFLSSNSFYTSSISADDSRVNSHNYQSRNISQFGKSKNQVTSNRSTPYGYRSSASSAPTNSNNNQSIAPIFQKTIHCPCSLIQASRFKVTPAAFQPQLIDAFKTIPSKLYNADTRVWSFHTDDYGLLRERVAPLHPNVTLGLLPRFVVKLIDDSKHKKNTSQACLNSLEPKIINALFPFQRLGVMFGIEKQGRCMIADEMGLGKTYQALALADFYKHDWPLLICTTAATRDSWLTAVQNLMPYVPKHKIGCMVSNMESISDFNVLVISYNLMERNCQQLLKRGFSFLILDESHLLKNVKAKSTSAAIELARRTKRVVCLTGTPALSRPSELFTQLQIIDPTFFSFKEYSTRYCDGKQKHFGWDATGQSNLEELNVILGLKFMIRRSKQDVLFDMGEKSRETVLLDPALIWTESETTENLQSYANDFISLKGRDRDDVLLKYYNETASAKSNAVAAYLKQLVRDGKKFIVFAHHRIMLDAISHCMNNLNVDHIRIDGHTKNDKRTMLIERFQTESDCKVAILSLKACNAGITLTAAQLVLFAELDWNPSTLAQAESRAHRIGQTGDVVCRYLLAKGTADDVIWEMLKNKQETLNKAGLFNDDLADGTVHIAPTSSQSITKYLNVTPKTTPQTKPSRSDTLTSDTSKSSLDDLFDGDDADFANIQF